MTDSSPPRSRVPTAADAVTAALGVMVVAGVYADGWAHLNVPTLELFFTPWHGLLYTAFTLLAGWVVLIVWRRRDRSRRWVRGAPGGYGLGLVGVGVFPVGGLADLG